MLPEKQDHGPEQPRGSHNARMDIGTAMLIQIALAMNKQWGSTRGEYLLLRAGVPTATIARVMSVTGNRRCKNMHCQKWEFSDSD